jgi:hypothetical protein
MSRPFRANSRISPTQGVALGWYVMPLRGCRPTGSLPGDRSYDQGPSELAAPTPKSSEALPEILR